jgi:hypothetical protein
VQEGVVDHAGEVGEGDVEGLGAGGCHGEGIVKSSLWDDLRFKVRRERRQVQLCLSPNLSTIPVSVLPRNATWPLQFTNISEHPIYLLLSANWRA